MPAKSNHGPQVNNIIGRLKKMGREMTVEAWAREGIPTENAIGVPLAELKSFARKLGADHLLAQGLWESGVYDARLLAALIDRPEQVSVEQMDRWVESFDCIQLCDHVCFNLFNRSGHAWTRIAIYAGSEFELARRAAFSLIWTLATHSKTATDDTMIAFLALIEKAATDGSEVVHRAVDLALRAVGKRNAPCNEAAVALARRLFKSPHASAAKIGDRAARELESEVVRSRFATGD